MTNTNEEHQNIDRVTPFFWHLKDLIRTLEEAKIESDKLHEDSHFKFSGDDKEKIKEYLEKVQELIAKI